MNYTEFVNAVKEKLTQELNGGVRVNVYTTKKNNATERTGLILETPGVNISPTIYLEEFFELYEKGKQMDWIIEDLVELYEKIMGLREDAFFRRGKRQNHLSTDQHREKQGITSGCST